MKGRVCSLSLLGILAAMGMVSAPYAAQVSPKFPAKPVRLVVPTPAAGVPDMLARMIAPKLGEIWGQTVVVDNRPGGSGVIANNVVAKAAPDGHTLLLTAGTFVVSAALNSQLPYHPFKDFAGVSQISSGTAVMVAPASLSVKTVPDLIALAKTSPGKIIFASNGISSGPFMQGEQFRIAAGLKLGHVAFAGTSQSLIETATGRVQFYVSTIAPALPFITDGRLVPLAIFTSPRSPMLPNVPLLEDTLPGIKRISTQGLLAPGGTPRVIVNQISKDIAYVLAMREIKEQFEKRGFAALPTTPEEYDRIMREQVEMISVLAKAAGIKSE